MPPPYSIQALCWREFRPKARPASRASAGFVPMNDEASTWLHPTVPLLAAPIGCAGGMISPPAKQRISKLPSVIPPTRLQSSSAEPLSVSRLFGQQVDKRHLTAAGNESAPHAGRCGSTHDEIASFHVAVLKQD